MNYMSKQEVFDKVATHLLAQGHTSFIRPKSAMCAYRGTDGSMCAAGRLISDHHYDPRFEGKRVGDPRVHEALLMSGVNMNDSRISAMVTQLQMLHDTIKPAHWGYQLADIATQHGIEYAAPADLKERKFMRMPTHTELWVEEGSAIVDHSMAIMDAAYATASIAKAKHQLVPPDVSVHQWVAAMMALQPALPPDIDNDSQPAPSVAHKQGVTA